MYISNEFYKKGEHTKNKTERFISALNFINLEIKKNNNLVDSDFVISF